MAVGRVDIDFIKQDTDSKDIDLFLGPVNETQNQVFIDSFDNKTLAHIMKDAGVFSSVSDARRNGWNKEVPSGFSHFIVGKKKSSIAILNIKEK